VKLWEKMRELLAPDEPEPCADPEVLPPYATMAALGSGMPRRGFCYWGKRNGFDIWRDEAGQTVCAYVDVDGTILVRVLWHNRVRRRFMLRTPVHVAMFLDEL